VKKSMVKNLVGMSLKYRLAAGFEWAGFSALAFYMHTILRDLTVPFDEYWIAFFLQLYRCHIYRTKSTSENIASKKGWNRGDRSEMHLL
jgi:hypothetical protein